MTDYHVAALGATRPEDLYICFRRPVLGDGVCWPLPWAGVWSEADVVRAAASLNDGVETVAVPREAAQALGTAPPPGKIDGDVGPVVRNSASNRRALVIAARREIVRLEAFEIPPADDAVRGDESVVKALAALTPLLSRENAVEDDRIWRLRAELLALLHSDDRRRIQRTVHAVHELPGKTDAAGPSPKTPPRPARPAQAPGHAEVAILRSPPSSAPPPPPPPDTEIGSKMLKV